MLEYSVCFVLSTFLYGLLRLLRERRKAKKKTLPNILRLIIGPMYAWMEMLYREWVVRDLRYSLLHRTGRHPILRGNAK